MKTKEAKKLENGNGKLAKVNVHPSHESQSQRNRRLALMFEMYCQLQGRHGCISDMASYFGLTTQAVSQLAARHNWQARFDASRDKFLDDANKISLRAFDMHMAAVDALIQDLMHKIMDYGIEYSLENLDKLLSIRERIAKISEGKTDDPESSKLVGAITNNITNFYRDIPESQRQQLDTDVADMLVAKRSTPVCVPETA